MTHAPNYLILDASCLLNLYATGRLRDIALALSYQLVVAGYVMQEEALYVRVPGPEGLFDERGSVNLCPLVEEGLIMVAHLKEPDEIITFVDFAALVDDGEAVTGALALHRGYSLATDDRRARRILRERAPTVSQVSTLELLKEWSDKRAVPVVELQVAMNLMQRSASFLPGERESLYWWWRSIMEEAGL